MFSRGGIKHPDPLPMLLLLVVAIKLFYLAKLFVTMPFSETTFFAVYEELMLTRDMAKDNKNKDVPAVEVTVSTESVVPQTQSEMVESVTYVNPKPGCSLINPNTPMREHMEKTWTL